MSYISDCCGAAATDPVMLDIGICPSCKDHCEFIDEDEEDEPDDYQIYNNFNHEGGIKFEPKQDNP